jgi:hypothetical protein
MMPMFGIFVTPSGTSILSFTVLVPACIRRLLVMVKVLVDTFFIIGQPAIVLKLLTIIV